MTRRLLNCRPGSNDSVVTWMTKDDRARGDEHMDTEVCRCKASTAPPRNVMLRTSGAAAAPAAAVPAAGLLPSNQTALQCLHIAKVFPAANDPTVAGSRVAVRNEWNELPEP